MLNTLVIFFFMELAHCEYELPFSAPDEKQFLAFSQTLIRYCMMSGKLNNEISSFCRFADSSDVKQVSIVQTIFVFQKNHSLDKDPPELCSYPAIWSTN